MENIILNISQKYLTSFYVSMTIPKWRALQILSQTHFIELLFSVSKRVHFLSEVQHNSTCHLNIQFSCQFWVRPVTDVTMVKLVNFSCVDVSIVEQYFIITTIRSLNNLLDILIRENWYPTVAAKYIYIRLAGRLPEECEEEDLGKYMLRTIRVRQAWRDKQLYNIPV